MNIPYVYKKFYLMNMYKFRSLLALMVLFGVFLQACKSKKLAIQPSAEVETVKEEPKPAPAPPPPAPVEKKEEPAPMAEKPNYQFKNILFEFDSGVLKTDSYTILDQITRELKKDLSVSIEIDGHASLEGSAEHNMSLSVDRANSVKLYLVNAGIDPANLTTKGFGATKPVSSNDTEAGRALNRRVEIKVIH
ncbi:OmpA-OmpF porin, OOP family [bacterium A37T11]|nr:OmpA-OmpF porin, OOP family [bacterium A37T11]